MGTQAMDCLPPQYNASTASVFDAFIDLFGTSYTRQSTNGGTAEQWTMWQSWLATQSKLSTKAGAAPAPYTLSALKQFEVARFYETMRLPGSSLSTAGTPPARYSAQIGATAVSCSGGSPNLCQQPKWASSIGVGGAQSVAPISWTTGSIAELITHDVALSNAMKETGRAGMSCAHGTHFCVQRTQ